MPIQTLEEYDKVLNVSWYAPEASREEQVYVEIIHNAQFRSHPNKLSFFTGSHVSCPSPGCTPCVVSIFGTS
jgi:hypothetical protein